MPDLAEDELRARIISGAMSALSVDTSVFDQYKCNLRYPALRKLDQFKSSNIEVVISDIVKGEVEGHIKRDAAETQRALRSSLASHRKRWALSADETAAPESYQLEVDPQQFAKQQVEEFMRAVGAKLVSASEFPAVSAEVLRRYFAYEPPFEDNQKKKHEFPDAFALLSLETWARENEKGLLCVSKDKGWRDFAANSEHLVWFDDLPKALSFFNEAGAQVAAHALARLRGGEAPEMLADIETAFEYRLDDLDFHVEAWAPFDFEAEPVGAALQAINWDTASQPTVIAIDSESVSFTFTVTAKVGFDAAITYYHHDSIDGDSVALATEDEYKEEDIEFEIALEVTREEQPVTLEAEVAKRRLEVDFGNMEPFRNEDPTFEKY